MAFPSRVIGYGFGELIRLVQVFRQGRPVHPRGLGLVGRLDRNPAGVRSGIAWLDESGTSRVQARMSRGLGLPTLLPDIIGLALRVDDAGGRCDVLLASTGRSRLSRFLVFFHRRVDPAVLGTLMPYKGTRGPVMLAARTLSPEKRLPASIAGFGRALGAEPWRLGLYWATPLGVWFRFGVLELQPEAGQPESDIRYDPVLNAPRGAQTYDWTRNLRERSYSLARRFGVHGRGRARYRKTD